MFVAHEFWFLFCLFEPINDQYQGTDVLLSVIVLHVVNLQPQTCEEEKYDIWCLGLLAFLNCVLS